MDTRTDSPERALLNAIRQDPARLLALPDHVYKSTIPNLPSVSAPDLEGLPEAAHFVTLDKGQKGAKYSFNTVKPSREKVKKHLHEGGWLGLIPGSVGLVVVDVDVKGGSLEEGRETALEALGEPLVETRTPGGGVHLYYRGSGQEKNGTWLGGDIRGSNGYVVIYDSEALFDAWVKAKTATPVDVGVLGYGQNSNPLREGVFGKSVALRI